MPLERKILLTILILIITLFSGYFIYDGYYLKYKKNLSLISKYNRLISGFESKDSNISENKITSLNNKIDRYKELFFTPEQADITVLTPYIKDKLLNSNLIINQYQGNQDSVRFSVRGKKENLLKFIYTLSKEKKLYDFPMFNIRMENNYDFTSTFEVKRVQLSNKPMDQYLSQNLKQSNNELPFKINVLNFMGTDFLDSIKTPVVEITSEPIVEAKLQELPKRENTNKFSYVGLLTKDSEVITMFKENVNGRVYKFQSGKTISEWTYIGKENNKYLFKKDDKIYEVKEWKDYI